MSQDIINWGKLEQDKAKIKKEFNNNDPFRYVVIEDFLDPNAAKAIENGFEEALAHKDPFGEKSHKNVLRKTGTPNLKVMTEKQRDFFSSVVTSKFVDFLKEITAINNIYGDPNLSGGGLHQSVKGAFLNVHTDFNFHPKNDTHRRLNLICYVNEEWKESWGGALELWNAKMSERKANLFPKFNRAVLFETSEISFHGHPIPLNCPVDVARKSMAVYYYSDWPEGLERRAKTNYVSTPEQKSKGLSVIENAIKEGKITTWEEASTLLPDVQPSHVKKLFRKFIS